MVADSFLFRTRDLASVASLRAESDFYPSLQRGQNSKVSDKRDIGLIEEDSAQVHSCHGYCKAPAVL
jgi:hypothetical protein